MKQIKIYTIELDRPLTFNILNDMDINYWIWDTKYAKGYTITKWEVIGC